MKKNRIYSLMFALVMICFVGCGYSLAIRPTSSILKVEKELVSEEVVAKEVVPSIDNQEDVFASIPKDSIATMSPEERLNLRSCLLLLEITELTKSQRRAVILKLIPMRFITRAKQ